MSYRTPLAAALAGLILCAWCNRAHALERTQPATADARGTAEQPPESVPSRPRIGAIAGVGFPRPLAIEAMVLLGPHGALGAEYGVLPTMTVGGVQVDLWSVAGDARFFPFRGAFFVGLRAGRQHIGASTTVALGSHGSAPEELSLDSWFLNPRVGFLWASRGGLAFGMEAGIQVPVGASVSSTLPLSLVPQAQSTADTIGNTVIPTFDLFRVGLLL
jgi:hypothetical protein